MKRLTTHVLDTVRGVPGAGITIDLYEIGAERRHVKTVTTNADGRTDKPILDEDAFKTGAWELVFHVGEYFAAWASELTEPPFLDQVPIRFGIGAEAHYHVPLLVSPYSYTTYRGS